MMSETFRNHANHLDNYIDTPQENGIPYFIDMVIQHNELKEVKVSYSNFMTQIDDWLNAVEGDQITYTTLVKTNLESSIKRIRLNKKNELESLKEGLGAARNKISLAKKALAGTKSVQWI